MLHKVQVPFKRYGIVIVSWRRPHMCLGKTAHHR